MPEGVGYGPQNTASIGLNLNVIGKHAYAYSGVINDAGTGAANALALKFTSGNYYFVGILDMITDTLVNDQRFVNVTFNGTSVFKGSWDNEPYALGGGPLTTLIIPPFTEVQVKWGSSGDKNSTIVLTGRIYGKVD